MLSDWDLFEKLALFGISSAGLAISVYNYRRARVKVKPVLATVLPVGMDSSRTPGLKIYLSNLGSSPFSVRSLTLRDTNGQVFKTIYDLADREAEPLLVSVGEGKGFRVHTPDYLLAQSIHLTLNDGSEHPLICGWNAEVFGRFYALTTEALFTSKGYQGRKAATGITLSRENKGGGLTSICVHPLDPFVSGGSISNLPKGRSPLLDEDMESLINTYPYLFKSRWPAGEPSTSILFGWSDEVLDWWATSKDMAKVEEWEAKVVASRNQEQIYFVQRRAA